MKMKFALTGIAAAIILSGCVVAPAPMSRPYYREPVMVAPPPPRVEYMGAPPVVGQVWINGFWNWSGNRHEWVPGRWEAPRPGQQWVPHRWERDNDHWRLQGGGWEEHRGHRDHDDHERHDRRDWR